METTKQSPVPWLKAIAVLVVAGLAFLSSADRARVPTDGELDAIEARVAALEAGRSGAADRHVRDAVGDLWDALEMLDARLDRIARRREIRAARAEAESTGAADRESALVPDQGRSRELLLERLSPGQSSDGAPGDRSSIAAWRLHAFDRRIDRIRGFIPDLSASQEEALREWMVEFPRRRADLMREIRAEGRTREEYLEASKGIDDEQDTRLREILDESQYREYRKNIRSRRR